MKLLYRAVSKIWDSVGLYTLIGATGVRQYANAMVV